MPLKSIHESLGLGPESCGHNLLPISLFSKMPQLLRVPYSIDEQYKEMRLVSIRFDPIKEEMRLVYQPLTVQIVGGGEKRFWADDAAIHLFYRVSKGSIVKIQKDLSKLFPRLSKNKLGVHPKYKKHVKKVQKLVCDYTKDNLFKLTFMNVRGNRVLWSFGGFFLRKSNEGVFEIHEQIKIANLHGVFEDPESGMNVQRISRIAGFIRAGVLPKPVRGDHLQGFFESSTERGPVNLEKIMLSVDRIENPKINNPDTVDCVSCHAADSTRRWLEKNGIAATKYRYKESKYVLNGSVDSHNMRNTANFRSFGYLDDRPSISRRTLNDTIEIQHFLKNQ